MRKKRPIDRRQRSETRKAIDRSIIAQMSGLILNVLMIQGGLLALLIISIIGMDSEFEIGLSISVLKWAMLARIVAGPVVDTVRRKRFLTRWVGVSAVASVFLIVIPFLPALIGESAAVALLILVVGIYSLALYYGGGAWFPLLSHILPSTLRGRYFGTMRRWWKITGFAAIIIAGLILGEDPSPRLFVFILVPVVMLQFVRVYFYSRLPDPPPARPVHEKATWRDLIIPLSDPHFRYFVVFVLMVGTAENVAMPFVVPFLRTVLEFPASVTMYAAAAITLGSIVSLKTWGRLADIWGNRITFLCSVLCIATAFGLLSVAPAYPDAEIFAFALAAVVLMVGGAGTAGAGIAYTVRLMKMSPEEYAGPYMNVIQSIIGVAGGIMALVTGTLLSRLPDTVPLFGGDISVFRFLFAGIPVLMLGVVWMLAELPRITEPRIREIARRVTAGLPNPFDTDR